MARPRTRSDEEILEVTRACIREHGPNVSTVTIAEQLGLSQSALFRRFGSKERLFRAALVPASGPAWIAEVQRGPDRRPLFDQLHALAVLLDEFYTDFAPHLQSVQAELSRSGPPRAGLARRARTVMTGWIERAVAQGLMSVPDPSVAAVAFIACAQAHALRSHALGDNQPARQRYLRGVVEMFCRAYASPGK